MRRVYQIALLLGLGSLPVAQVAAADRVAMPFDCGLERGRVWVAPSAENSYEIVGMREQQTVTACDASPAGACRTVMVHRFAISCGGDVVAWMRVAAAIRRGAGMRAWIEDGRLNLVLAPRAMPAAADCLDPRSSGGVLERRVVLSRDCLPWRKKAGLAHMVLPPGFAPVGELGARLLLVSPIEEVAPTAGLAGAEISLVKADPNAVLSPSAAVRTFDGALQPALSVDDWITVVRATDDHPVAAAAAPLPTTHPWPWLLAALLAATGAVVARARYATRRSLRAVAPAPRLRLLSRRSVSAVDPALAAIDPTIANASAAVAAMLRQTETAAAQLKGAAPLRDVLNAEMAQVRQRLANLESHVVKGEMPAEKSAPRFRNLVRDLERIGRIVDSAVASLSGARKATTLPRTISEAYDVLGVNAEVSAGVLKKIVDALRMSWHPDHARDEADRSLREARMQQINIAWELISKREAA